MFTQYGSGIGEQSILKIQQYLHSYRIIADIFKVYQINAFYNFEYFYKRYEKNNFFFFVY